jgi:5-methyltetrahydrofolate--homocysteine methyltransferase
MMIIGEKINTVNKKVADALKKKDRAFFQNIALSQVRTGIIKAVDVNVGSDPEQEPDNMRWAVSCIEEVLADHVPLAIDSSNPEVIIAGIEQIKNKKGSILNSITFEESRYKDLLPLVRDYDLDVIALPIDKNGIPQTAEKRLEIARKLVDLVESYGISRTKLYLDCIVEPVSISCEKALISLDTVNKINQYLPEVKTFICLSAISFGLPDRRLINRSFLSLLLSRGLDSVILDPLDDMLVQTLFASNVLLGKDEYCQKYLELFRNK